MAVTTTFINDSKAHDAREFTDYFARLVPDGVFAEPATALQVSVEGMTVKVKAGAGFVRGVMIANDSDLSLTIDTTASARIDRVVMGVDQSKPSAGIYVLKGTDGTTTAPELANTNSKRELCLAEIMVMPNGVSSCRDTRLTNLCGVVRKRLDPVGTIKMFGGSTAPDGYLMCDGAAVSRTDYASLFAAIGTTYGAGDGSTTFNLPDLKGRFPLGAGAGNGLTARTVGQKDGEEGHALTIEEMPVHSHVPSASSEYFVTTEDSGANNTRVAYSSSGNRWVDGLTSESHFHHRTRTDTVGSGAVHNNMPPYAVVSYIISTGL